MKLKRTFFNTIFLLVFFIVGKSSIAQQTNLSAYIVLVKKNNLALKQGESRIKIANEETKIAKSLLLPNASVDGFYQRDLSKNYLFIHDEFDGTVTRFRTNFNNTLDLTATVSQAIFDPTAFADFKISKLAEELQNIGQEHLSNELLVNAAKLYWQAIFLKESIGVLEENNALAKVQFDQIQKIHKKGVVSKLELHQAEALYKNTIPSLNNAQTQYQNVLNELKTLANIPINENLVLTDKLEFMQLDGILEKQERNVENQPQIRSMKKEIELTEKQLQAKRKYWYPRLNLIAGYNYSGQDNSFRLSNNENKLFFGQLRISFPIFSGGRNNAEITKAKIEKDLVEQQLKSQRQELLKQLQIAENNYHNTIGNIAIHKEAIALQEKEIQVFNKQLEMGVVTIIELKEVRLRLTQNKLDLLNDYLDLHIAKLQIRRCLGVGI